MKRIIQSKITWIVVILLVVATALFTSWSTWKQEQELVRKPLTLAQGQEIYEANCQSCHGVMAQGQDPATPMGGMDRQNNYIAPALDSTGHAWHHADELLFNIIQHGSPAQDSPMRGFAGRLNDREAWAVIHWFQSLWKAEHLQMQQFMTK